MFPDGALAIDTMNGGGWAEVVRREMDMLSYELCSLPRIHPHLGQGILVFVSFAFGTMVEFAQHFAE